MELNFNMKNILIDKQKKLVSKICLDNKIDINNLHTIAGVDLAYWKKEGKEYACCCIVAIDYESKAVVEKKYCIGEVNIPYISGCLAFREYELVERTIS